MSNFEFVKATFISKGMDQKSLDGSQFAARMAAARTINEGEGALFLIDCLSH
jgi:hypothetical protein